MFNVYVKKVTGLGQYVTAPRRQVELDKILKCICHNLTRQCGDVLTYASQHATAKVSLSPRRGVGFSSRLFNGANMYPYALWNYNKNVETVCT